MTPLSLTPAKICAATLQLTRVLQDSLGGSARTALIVCCSPSSEDAAETLSSLRFGSRARGIVNTVHSNVGRLAATQAEHVLKQQLKVCRGALRQNELGWRNACRSVSLPAAEFEMVAYKGLLL